MPHTNNQPIWYAHTWYTLQQQISNSFVLKLIISRDIVDMLLHRERSDFFIFRRRFFFDSEIFIGDNVLKMEKKKYLFYFFLHRCRYRDVHFEINRELTKNHAIWIHKVLVVQFRTFVFSEKKLSIYMWGFT